MPKAPPSAAHPRPRVLLRRNRASPIKWLAARSAGAAMSARPVSDSKLRPLRRRHTQRASSRLAYRACMTMHDQPVPKRTDLPPTGRSSGGCLQAPVGAHPGCRKAPQDGPVELAVVTEGSRQAERERAHRRRSERLCVCRIFALIGYRTGRLHTARASRTPQFGVPAPGQRHRRLLLATKTAQRETAAAVGQFGGANWAPDPARDVGASSHYGPRCRLPA